MFNRAADQTNQLSWNNCLMRNDTNVTPEKSETVRDVSDILKWETECLETVLTVWTSHQNHIQLSLKHHTLSAKINRDWKKLISFSQLLNMASNTQSYSLMFCGIIKRSVTWICAASHRIGRPWDSSNEALKIISSTYTWIFRFRATDSRESWSRSTETRPEPSVKQDRLIEKSGSILWILSNVWVMHHKIKEIWISFDLKPALATFIII